MKKFILISVAAIGMIYAACSGSQHTSKLNHDPVAATSDTAMEGDAMKKDSMH